MKIWLAILSLCVSGAVFAHGPTPQKTDETVQVAATPDVIWKKISEPCGVSKWHPEIAECEVVNEKQQRLTLKNGKKILQEIDEIATAEMTIAYRFAGEVDITALPVSSLNGKIKVAADGSGAKVSWTARYYRAFTGNEPPAGQDDESAKNAIDAFVKAGLNGLKENKSSAKTISNKTADIAGCCMMVKNFLKKLGLSF
jgi:mxaD protein